MSFVDLVENRGQSARIVVVGVGGAGGNAVDRMIEANPAGLQFIAVNTDEQALTRSRAPRRIQIGRQRTRGLGSGGDPEQGRAAIRESEGDVAAALQGTDMVFIAAGMGGGTGTGVAPGIARLARAQGALTVAVVTTPFRFEGRVRLRQAEEGLAELANEVDAIIVIANESLLELVPPQTSMREAFKASDEALCAAVRGLHQMVASPGLINLDLRDVSAALRNMGQAVMSTGRAAGDDRAVAAARSALNSPLLNSAKLGAAAGVLVNFEGRDPGIAEVSQAMAEIQAAVGEQAQILMGCSQNEALGDQLQVTLIVGGVNRPLGGPASRPENLIVSAPILDADSAAAPPRVAQIAAPRPRRAPSTQADLSRLAAPQPRRTSSTQADLSRLMGWDERESRGVAPVPGPPRRFGMDLGTSCSAPAPGTGTRPGPPPQPDGDVVNCSVFSPARMRPGHSYLVQVFVHLPVGGAEAAAIAKEADPEASRRGFSSLAAAVARGSSLSFHLAMSGLEITDPYASALWGGDTTAVNFAVSVPAGHVAGDVVGRVTVVQRGLPIGLISFVVGIVAARPERRETAVEGEAPGWVGRARRYHRAFVSYASRDRAEVMKRVQVLDTLCIGYFQDLLSLSAGERWERGLQRLIDESDVFLLFWSRASRESQHVLAEVDYALRRKGGVEDNPPDIIPIPIEGPPIPEPPPSLRHLHFDARSLYFMRDGGAS